MSEKTSRRSALKYGIAAIAGLAVGGVAGFTASQQMAPTPPKAKWGEAPPEGTKVVLQNVCDAAYPPYTSVDASGKAVGFDIDALQAVADMYGWEVNTKPWDWASIITALNAGDADLVWSGMTVTPERSKVVWFTMPYQKYLHYLFTLAEDTRSMQDILNSGDTIAVMIGATPDFWATKRLEAGDNFQKLALDSMPAAMQAVMDGRAAAVVVDSSYSDFFIRENPDKAALFRLVSSVGPMKVYAIAVRIEDVWLRNQLNAGLDELMNSPKWDDLRAKWKLP
jgi:polar amino acid transport system substrate-binding protein